MFALPSVELRVRLRRPHDAAQRTERYRRVALRLRRDPSVGQGRVWHWVVDVDPALPVLNEVLAGCPGFLVEDDCGRAVGVVEGVQLGGHSTDPVRLFVVRGWGGQWLTTSVSEVIEVAPGARRLVVACGEEHAAVTSETGKARPILRRSARWVPMIKSLLTQLIRRASR